MARNVLSAFQRYQQTAHSAEPLSESVIITNPIHPLYGQSVKVLSWRSWGKTTRVIISHPEGGTLSLPASETGASNGWGRAEREINDQTVC